jgi:hypothetical protein
MAIMVMSVELKASDAWTLPADATVDSPATPARLSERLDKLERQQLEQQEWITLLQAQHEKIRGVVEPLDRTVRQMMPVVLQWRALQRLFPGMAEFPLSHSSKQQRMSGG